ncbi:hypothetical protein K3495_g4125 [Podosphaera aphanis]|nr:hypothetical protein K3495_g4125 [Podosphaera aphanis]
MNSFLVKFPRSIRPLARGLRQRSLRPITASRKMSLFPRSFITNDQSPLPPIFRLLDEFDQYSRNSESPIHSQMKSFTPKFDVKEEKDSYELHGELPGIDQKNIEIEFTDASTITIKGHVERKYTEGNSPLNVIEGSKINQDSTKSHTPSSNYTESEKNLQSHNSKPESEEIEAKRAPEERFWVMERSVGEFSRSFSFPTPVDQESVRASMKNGILSVVIPKTKKPEGRKITIQSCE